MGCVQGLLLVPASKIESFDFVKLMSDLQEQSSVLLLDILFGSFLGRCDKLDLVILLQQKKDNE